jgi:hypothetical protein
MRYFSVSARRSGSASTPPRRRGFPSPFGASAGSASTALDRIAQGVSPRATRSCRRRRASGRDVPSGKNERYQPSPRQSSRRRSAAPCTSGRSVHPAGEAPRPGPAQVVEERRCSGSLGAGDEEAGRMRDACVCSPSSTSLASRRWQMRALTDPTWQSPSRRQPTAVCPTPRAARRSERASQAPAARFPPGTDRRWRAARNPPRTTSGGRACPSR